MKNNFKQFIHRMEYKSLVLLNQACCDLKKYDNLYFVSIDNLTEHFMKDEELEQDAKYNNVLQRVPANGEEFAYSVRNFKTEYLWDLCEFFEYAYIVSNNEVYHRTYECIRLVLMRRKELIDLVFSKCQSMSIEDIEFYINLIPEGELDMMSDYMLVLPRDITEEYLRNEFNKEKNLGRVLCYE